MRHAVLLAACLLMGAALPACTGESAGSELPDVVVDTPVPDAVDLPDAPHDAEAVDAQPDTAEGPADAAFDAQDTTPPPPAVILGPATHVIVLEPDASPSEVHAADELRAHWLACTGADLPVLQAPPDDGTPMVVLGQGPTALSLGVDPDPAALGEQGYVLKTVPPHVVIAGTAAAGTLYGVHRFLEEFVGVRWYAPGVTKTPHVEQVAVPELDRVVTPAFSWRTTYYTWPGADADFWARQGGNSGGGGPDNPQGTQYAFDGQAHSYFSFLSPDEYFDAHPEYFSEIGGVRQREDTQLCLTNPDVLEIVTEKMLARMEAMPGVRQHNFSQMDHYNYCQCDACRAVNEQYQTSGGTQFWFVNELAKRTAPVYPDKQIGTLAYMYTEEPPVGLELHPNVAVWLCHMFPSCDSHATETCPLEADYLRRVTAWAGLTDHLYIWHYIVDFMHYYAPFPNWRGMAANLRLYRSLGVEGIFLQGMGQGGGGGEFSLLRPWYGMKLLWDPFVDADRLIDDFLGGYYGAAAPYIRQWIDRVQAKVDDEGIHMHLYTNPAEGYLTDDVVADGEAWFDQAEAAVAGDSELLDRVQVARMPLLYARFFPRDGYELADGKLHWRHAIPKPAELKAFLDRMEAHGFTTVREVAGSPDTMNLAYAVVGKDQAYKTIANAALALDVVPAMAGRALRLTHKATGQSVTAYDRGPNLYFPFTGGLDDHVGAEFEYYGWVEPAFVTAQDASSLTVRLTTMNGFTIERTYALEGDLPVLHVTTKLTNPGAGAVTTRLRAHLELDLGDVPTTRVTFTDKGGQAVEQTLQGPVDALREGTRFYAQQAPDGAWTFEGTKGLRLTQSFDPSAVDFTWIYAFPVSLGQFDVEVWAPKVTLQPGESVTTGYTLEVRPVD